MASDEDVFSHLSSRPDYLLGPMITVDEPANLCTLARHPGPSSLGRLDPLSLEILHEILYLLDIKSLSRLSRVSHRGRATVESLPIYRTLMKCVPDTLKALGQTRLLRFYTANQLRAVLRTKDCVICGKFGPFVFLPTAERCCYYCQLYHKRFRMISIPRAQTIHNLERRELNRLNVLNTIPGVYKTQVVKKWRRLRLVTYDAASKLAKAKVAEERARNKSSAPIPGTNITTFGAPAGATNDGLDSENLMLACCMMPWPDSDDSDLSPQNNEFGGMSSIQFPYLRPDNVLEHGHLCKGCEWVYSHYESKDLPDSVLYDLELGSEYQVSHALQEKSLRVMVKSEFLTHVAECYGAQKLLALLDTEGQRK
ncbi:uncharacterized protein GIQ15_05333 [Arthroderma uncinatum]|uniref:uncharacterized protein n=1 Tax=Arthroderma uncinatum TaxID=74035 RepID=UPI00144A9652|nr:uncharacterized protein GIQ15_05333 [Arthroderma uncinatum]KAF3482574.1 hypothetical protein GIQ15_05333 [Arthroderma uncinatum]